MASPLRKTIAGARVTRALGHRLVARRADQAARKRSRALQRELPLQLWDDVSLVSELSDVALADPASYLSYRRERAPSFFFDPESRPEWRGQFASWDELQSPVAEAEGAIDGHVRLFSRTTVYLGDPPHWLRNPLTCEEWPAGEHFTESDDAGYGDINVLLDANRFHFAYPLVRAYWRSGNERYAEGFWQLCEQWRVANPPNHGPNWKSGAEASIRVVAWCFALYGLLDAAATNPERTIGLAQAIAYSGRRIEATIDDATREPSARAILDGMGLWTIGALFPEFRLARRWRRIGRIVLERLGQRLIYGDGSFAPHSLNDHRLMLDAYVWSMRLGELINQPFSRDLTEAIGRAADWLYQLQDEATGRVPNYGANDGTLLLPLTNSDYQDFRPAVQAARYFTTRTCTFERGPWDEQLFWLFGDRALAAEAAPSPRVDFQARDGGYYTLRSATGFAFVRAADFRHPPDHADQLHVDLWWRGINIALDPGTFSAHAPIPWHHALAPTAFHNTVTVDLQSQLEVDARAQFLPWPRGEARRAMRSSSGQIAYWEGSHDGYLRLSPGAVHRRAIIRLGDEHWCVLDEVRSREPHICRLHWLLADWPYELRVTNQKGDLGDAVTLCLHTPTGPYSVYAQGRHAPARVSLVRADPFSARGWRSAYYQHREPAVSLSLTREASIERFCTVFGPNGYQVEISPELVHIKNEGIDATITGSSVDRLLASAISIRGVDHLTLPG
jgi:asparagine synthase (glutamine-hydrolysing)